MNKYYIAYGYQFLRSMQFSYVVLTFNKQLTEKNLEEIKEEIVKECYENFEITVKKDDVVIMGAIKLDE